MGSALANFTVPFASEFLDVLFDLVGGGAGGSWLLLELAVVATTDDAWDAVSMPLSSPFSFTAAPFPLFFLAIATCSPVQSLMGLGRSGSVAMEGFRGGLRGSRGRGVSRSN